MLQRLKAVRRSRLALGAAVAMVALALLSNRGGLSQASLDAVSTVVMLRAGGMEEGEDQRPPRPANVDEEADEDLLSGKPHFDAAVATAAARDHEGAGQRGDEIPVVAFYSADKIDSSHYQWLSLRSTIEHGNKVVLLTNAKIDPPKDLEGRFSTADLADLDSARLQRFLTTYKPWGLKEPWESFNFRRFFYLAEYMNREKLDHVFFADSDVALFSKVSRDLLQPGCDSLIDMKNSTKKAAWKTYGWSVWAGSGVLSREVVNEWCDFVLAMYAGPQVETVLRVKKTKRPYVCDMTLWYLYVVAADEARAAEWGAAEARSTLPATPARHMCESVLYGFDHQSGYRKKGFAFDKSSGVVSINGEPLRSVHFQGVTGKKVLQSFFTKSRKK